MHGPCMPCPSCGVGLSFMDLISKATSTLPIFSNSKLALKGSPGLKGLVGLENMT